MPIAFSTGFKTSLACSAAVSALMLSRLAAADEPARVGGGPATEQAQVPNREAPRETTVPLENPSASAGCFLGEHDGFDPADAKTAARITCGELAKANADTSLRYRVTLEKLGTSIVLAVVATNPDGHEVERREVQLSSIEEVRVGSARVANALVKRIPVEETASVSSIVGDEARTPRTRGGQMGFGAGVVGLVPPFDANLTPAPGLSFQLFYAAPRHELGGELRFAVRGGDEKVGYFSTGFGGKYFFTSGDVSPYIGGALNVTYLNLSIAESSRYFEKDAWGIGASGELGVEFFRTHKSRLTAGVRVDAPFFSVGSRYYPPISFGVTFKSF